MCTNSPTNPNEARAWEILEEAEKSDAIMEMAKERAAYGDYPAPETVSDYLMWIIDEELVQRSQVALFPDDPDEADRLPYANYLANLSTVLQALDFKPITPYWHPKPCPFCGSDDVHIHPFDASDCGDEKTLYTVACSACESTGPITKKSYKAVSEWNRRV